MLFVQTNAINNTLHRNCYDQYSFISIFEDALRGSDFDSYTAASFAEPALKWVFQQDSILIMK